MLSYPRWHLITNYEVYLFCLDLRVSFRFVGRNGVFKIIDNGRDTGGRWLRLARMWLEGCTRVHTKNVDDVNRVSDEAPGVPASHAHAHMRPSMRGYSRIPAAKVATQSSNGPMPWCPAFICLKKKKNLYGWKCARFQSSRSGSVVRNV